MQDLSDPAELTPPAPEVGKVVVRDQTDVNPARLRPLGFIRIAPATDAGPPLDSARRVAAQLRQVMLMPYPR
jgi:hypothetical protein